METLLKALKSRTNWVIALTFLVNTSPLITPYVSGETMVLINSVLGALAVYFKMSPSQDY